MFLLERIFYLLIFFSVGSKKRVHVPSFTTFKSDVSFRGNFQFFSFFFQLARNNLYIFLLLLITKTKKENNNNNAHVMKMEI